MTSKLTREQLRERAQLKAKNLAGAISQSAFANCRSELEEELQFLQCALACMEEEPVEPIFGAKKYPVSRPVPGASLIVWDETGKFVGYGSAVDTRYCGVAIQMSDGRRFDSNHDLRWQYALQPVPVVDSEPVAWLNGCNKSVPAALRYLAENPRPIGGESSFNAAHLYQLAREIELMAEAPLYRHAQPAVDSDFIPKNLDKALGVLGMAIPESREEFNFQTERWIQRLIDRVIRYADEFQEQPAPVVQMIPEESRCDNSPANDTNVVKRLTITLPDTSSKAFWSGAGKTETFHPVTYRRWAKEAIERCCAIARIDVEVK